MATDYYAVLALSRNATKQQIRERFLELARQRHPDRFRGEEKARAEAEFQAITEAFNVLSHAERRRLHDLELSRPITQQTGVDTAQVARVYMQRGIKAYNGKKYLEAAENFDRATRAEPENAQAWYYLARACSHQSRWLRRAMTAIEKACELERMNPTYRQLAGRLFAEGGMPLRAEKYYREALQWGGENPEIKAALEALKKRGR